MSNVRDNNNQYPAIRFAGFTDPWVQYKLESLFEKNLEKNKTQFEVSKTISISTMRFNNRGNGAAHDSLSSYKVLRIGDIAFEGHTSK